MTDLNTVLTKMTVTDRTSIVLLCELTSVLKKMSSDEKDALISITNMMGDETKGKKKRRKKRKM